MEIGAILDSGEEESGEEAVVAAALSSLVYQPRATRFVAGRVLLREGRSARAQKGGSMKAFAVGAGIAFSMMAGATAWGQSPTVGDTGPAATQQPSQHTIQMVQAQRSRGSR